MKVIKLRFLPFVKTTSSSMPLSQLSAPINGLSSDLDGDGHWSRPPSSCRWMDDDRRDGEWVMIIGNVVDFLVYFSIYISSCLFVAHWQTLRVVWDSKFYEQEWLDICRISLHGRMAECWLKCNRREYLCQLQALGEERLVRGWVEVRTDEPGRVFIYYTSQHIIT